MKIFCHKFIWKLWRWIWNSIVFFIKNFSRNNLWI